MTVVPPRDVARFLSAPPDVAVVLLHGADLGLVRDRAQEIGKKIVEDLNDPFNAIELTEADLSEPGRLSDEAAALSFMGGKRLIRIRSGGNAVTAAVSLFLDGHTTQRVKTNALIVVEGGELSKANALRKLCEGHGAAAAIACYPEEARGVMDTVRTQLQTEGLAIRDDALALLSAQLGEDRGITRQMTEALILYKGPKGVPRDSDDITTDDVRACVVDSAADATFDIVDAALSGEARALSLHLYRGEMAGVSPIAVLRILQGKLLRLLTAQAAMREGESLSGAIKRVRPPVFFGEQRMFERQLKAWTLAALERAVQDVLEADLAAKTTGAPQRELIERTLLRLAVQAARGR